MMSPLLAEQTFSEAHVSGLKTTSWKDRYSFCPPLGEGRTINSSFGMGQRDFLQRRAERKLRPRSPETCVLFENSARVARITRCVHRSRFTLVVRARRSAFARVINARANATISSSDVVRPSE